ncbi:lipopolysaccharide biosynthesis protein [candidate division KSB1 bacterium]|nr:lipopolysaccharide biosynthesis protein [candidate division KSB1 bacterium]RQW01193.1 MAG: lipopolysaccharide biosynthesis protein [candidate division KSB1 bacterium]
MFSIASTMVLARLLTPKDFGLLAMVTAVTEFARSFRELGLGTLTVQREEINHAQVSTLFWINVSIGILIMLLLITISPLLVWFYSERRLLNICIVLSSIFFISGLTVQHRALLERQMKFGSLGVITIISYLGGFCVAIYLALHGYGVWTLVASEVLSALLFALGTWLFCRWLPGPPQKKTDMKASLQFGSDVSLFEIIQYFSRNIDRMLIGRFYGANSLGLYAKGFQLAMMPIEQIRMVFWDIGFSPLSTLQSDADRFRSFYSRFTSIMSFIYMPIVVFLVIKSESVILLLLGANWKSAAPILRIIALGGFFRPVVATFQLIMVSCGRTRRYVKWGMINSLIMIISFALGILWGPIGIAYAFAIASFISLLGAFLYCLKDTPVSAPLIFQNIKIPFLASWGAGLVVVLLPANIYPTGILLQIITLVFLLFLSYAGILLCIPKGRQQFLEFWSYGKELFVKA